MRVQPQPGRRVSQGLAEYVDAFRPRPRGSRRPALLVDDDVEDDLARRLGLDIDDLPAPIPDAHGGPKKPTDFAADSLARAATDVPKPVARLDGRLP